MKNAFNLILAFAFGVATLAACQKVVDVPKASSAPTVSGPTTELEKMGAVKMVPGNVAVPQAAKAAPAPSAAAVATQSKVEAHRASAVSAARASFNKAHQAKVAAGKGKAHAADRARAERAAYEKAYANAVTANKLLGRHAYQTSYHKEAVKAAPKAPAARSAKSHSKRK